MSSYDAILIVGFGGPEGPDDVLPFLENVLRGKNVPHARMMQVAEHYMHFGGVSPINEQVRALIAALVAELNTHGPNLPVYWGNRNWHPMLADTLREMADDGIRRALGIFLSPYSSYSSCRQYRENVDAARAEVGPDAPQVERLRAFYNHPGFIAAMADRVNAAFAKLPADQRDAARLIFTAHSIPLDMARGCRYESQLRESCRLVGAATGHTAWNLVYQSRSGPPTQPWLEPDIGDHLRAEHAAGRLPAAVIVPIGFLSDHMEVLYDLDTEAAAICEELNIPMVRAGTAGTHPKLIETLRLLIAERLTDSPTKLTLGHDGPWPDVCAVNCCPARAT